MREDEEKGPPGSQGPGQRGSDWTTGGEGGGDPDHPYTGPEGEEKEEEEDDDEEEDEARSRGNERVQGRSGDR